MTKQSYDDFNPQYIENADVLGITRLKSFFYIKLPIMTNDFLIIFGVSFSVCFYQFLQGIIVTKGEELLFNNEVLILFQVKVSVPQVPDHYLISSRRDYY